MKLSIVIPATGSQAEIDDTLVSVLENRPTDCEILLSHPVGYVDPYQLDDEVRLISSSRSDSVSLLNAGISMAQGRIIHTLCPGTRVRAGWCKHATHVFDDDASVAAVAPSVYLSPAKRPVRGVTYHVGAGKRLVRHENQTVLAPVLASGFYLRRVMQFMHGFDARFQAWADIELGLRMASAKYRCVADERLQIQVSPASFQQPLNGFRAGQIRGSLFQRAKAFGFASSQGLSLWSEPFRNGWGTSMFTGFVGRLVCPPMELVREQGLESTTDEIASRQAA